MFQMYTSTSVSNHIIAIDVCVCFLLLKAIYTSVSNHIIAIDVHILLNTPACSREKRSFVFTLWHFVVTITYPLILMTCALKYA
jgi:hypothetical protein